MDNNQRLRALAAMLSSAIGLCNAVYWLVTGEKPPHYSDVLKSYS